MSRLVKEADKLLPGTILTFTNKQVLPIDWGNKKIIIKSFDKIASWYSWSFIDIPNEQHTWDINTLIYVGSVYCNKRKAPAWL